MRRQIHFGFLVITDHIADNEHQCIEMHDEHFCYICIYLNYLCPRPSQLCPLKLIGIKF